MTTAMTEDIVQATADPTKMGVKLPHRSKAGPAPKARAADRKPLMDT